MDSREKRVARNEALFREVNERIEDLAERLGGNERTDFICECGADDCTAPITLTLREYEQVRAAANLFAVLPDHVAPDVESVVEEREGYVVIAKRPGAPTEIAHETDPRE